MVASIKRFSAAVDALSVARELPRLCQEVLGYSVHDAIEMAGGYLGALNLRDPVDLLANGEL